MKKIFAFAMLFISTTSVYAEDVKVVRCFNPSKPKHFVQLVLNSKNKIVPATKNKFVLSDESKSSDFSYLSMDLEAAGFEAIRTVMGRNGYSIITFITTADAVKIGVDATLTRGFYEYKDIGSGNGDKNYSLTCQRIK